MSERELKSEVFEQLAVVAKALSNGKRLELIEFLAQGEQPVERLARLARLGVTSVSSHLQVLKRAGLVRTRRDKTTINYRLAGEDVAALSSLISKVASSRVPEVERAWHAYLETGNNELPPPARIDRSHLIAHLHSGDATVLDVRPRNEFDAGHVAGAISIPLAELSSRIGELPPGTPVVVYCRGRFCKMARDAAQLLNRRGIDASAMDEGVLEWRASGEITLDATA